MVSGDCHVDVQGLRDPEGAQRIRIRPDRAHHVVGSVLVGAAPPSGAAVVIGAASEGAEYRAWWERRRELVPPVVGEASVKDAVPAAVAITMVDAHASAPRVRQRRTHSRAFPAERPQAWATTAL